MMESVNLDFAKPQGLRSMVRDYERTLIVNALTSTGGHQRRAAAALGILPTTLVEKMKRLGISGRRTRRVIELRETTSH